MAFGPYPTLLTSCQLRPAMYRTQKLSRRGLVPDQVLTVDEMRQDLDAQRLPKNAGVHGGTSSIFGSVLSARDGTCRRQLALDLGLVFP